MKYKLLQSPDGWTNWSQIGDVKQTWKEIWTLFTEQKNSNPENTYVILNQ